MPCEWKKVKMIIEAEACPDHIHTLLEIPPKVAESSFVGYLKGKSSLMVYEKYPELKYKYRNREVWCRGYYVNTVEKMQRRSKNIYVTNWRRTRQENNGRWEISEPVYG